MKKVLIDKADYIASRLDTEEYELLYLIYMEGVVSLKDLRGEFSSITPCFLEKCLDRLLAYKVIELSGECNDKYYVLSNTGIYLIDYLRENMPDEWIKRYNSIKYPEVSEEKEKKYKFKKAI